MRWQHSQTKQCNRVTMRRRNVALAEPVLALRRRAEPEQAMLWWYGLFWRCAGGRAWLGLALVVEPVLALC